MYRDADVRVATATYHRTGCMSNEYEQSGFSKLQTRLTADSVDQKEGAVVRTPTCYRPVIRTVSYWWNTPFWSEEPWVWRCDGQLLQVKVYGHNHGHNFGYEW